VNWDDARRYVSWLSQVTGKPYRLLSEAEFEYAARAGTETAYPWSGEVGMHANCTDCSSHLEQTMPVGSFAANPFGLYDMQGNVDEWVADCMHESYQGAPDDGSAWTTPDCHGAAARGGSWAHDSESLRSSSRNDYWPEFRAPFIGFRVARTLSTDSCGAPGC
jgi:formylglycine-generating enzyme required for sulfatase activity